MTAATIQSQIDSELSRVAAYDRMVREYERLGITGTAIMYRAKSLASKIRIAQLKPQLILASK